MAAIIKREPEEKPEEEESVCGAYTDPEQMARQRRILTQEEGEAFLRSLSEPPGEITPEIRRALLNYKRLVREPKEDLHDKQPHRKVV